LNPRILVRRINKYQPLFSISYGTGASLEYLLLTIKNNFTFKRKVVKLLVKRVVIKDYDNMEIQLQINLGKEVFGIPISRIA